jgi:allantoinase
MARGGEDEKMTTATDFDLVVSGKVVLTDRILDEGWVAVRDGKIAAIGIGGIGKAPGAKERHDFKGCLVLPGAIDSQTHSKSQKDQEDFIWSTRSAAAGGVTTIVDMPYDDGLLICTAERLKQKADEAKAQARVDFALYGTSHPNDGASHIDEMVEAGAAAFKFSTFGTHPERFPRIPPHTMYECFSAIAKHGLIGGVHNENDEAVRAYVARVKEQGITDYTAQGLSRPPLTETLAIAEVYEIGVASGCSAHIVHCSLERGYELCQSYRTQGFDTTIEACIHYLVLDEENHVRKLVGKGKVNPPIRPRKEVEALWQHLAKGNITVVSTDHVSWSEDRKNKPDMLENSSGAPGLEVLYALLLKGLEERGLSLTWAPRLLAANPARLFRIDHLKGALELGRDADIAVLKPERHKYHAGTSGHNVISWSPYEGMELPYKIVATFLRGREVFDGGKQVAEPGTGEFIRPRTASQIMSAERAKQPV